MRYAIAALVAVAATACSPDLPPPHAVPPPAPDQLTLGLGGASYSYTCDRVGGFYSGRSSCAGAMGLGPAFDSQCVTSASTNPVMSAKVLFNAPPAESIAPGTVYDLSAEGSADLVVVTAEVGNGTYCSNATSAASSGLVVVHEFLQYDGRWVADVELEGVVIPTIDGGKTATLDAHLYN